MARCLGTGDVGDLNACPDADRPVALHEARLAVAEARPAVLVEHCDRLTGRTDQLRRSAGAGQRS